LLLVRKLKSFIYSKLLAMSDTTGRRPMVASGKSSKLRCSYHLSYKSIKNSTGHYLYFYLVTLCTTFDAIFVLTDYKINHGQCSGVDWW